MKLRHLAFAFCLSPLYLAAATFTIADGDVAGLIAAIHSANSLPGPDVIELAPGGTYTLTEVGEDDGWSAAAGLPYIIHGALTINGHGATIQRSSAPGTPDFRILFAGETDLVLDGVTIRGGSGGNGNRGGAGIGMTATNALIRNCTITDNHGNHGGGIYVTGGLLTILNSTISYNSGFGSYGGGGILNFAGSATISFSTIFENRATGAPGFEGRGDAIADAFSAPGSIVLKNSVLASPTQGLGGACYATGVALNSLGGSIASDLSCGLTGPGDLNNVNPLLGPIAANGGLTPTHLPQAGSPVINAAASCSDAGGATIAADQRGIARPQGSACDTGSVELVLAPVYHACLLYDANKAAQSGATIPIKLTLCDTVGQDLSSASITLQATAVTPVATGTPGPAQSSGNANPNEEFRFDPTLGASGGYIYNLSTKGLASGFYNLNFLVSGDSFVFSAPFRIR